MICPNCKKQISSNATFCGYCRTQISGNNDQISRTKEDKRDGKAKNNSFTMFIICFLIAVILGAGSFLAVKKFSNNAVPTDETTKSENGKVDYLHKNSEADSSEKKDTDIKSGKSQEEETSAKPDKSQEEETSAKPDKSQEEATGTNTKTSENGSAAADVADTEENLRNDYGIYSDTTYGFSCPYPSEFESIQPEGVNAIKAYRSSDNKATMTIRACPNPGMNAEKALGDFFAVYKGDVVNQNLVEDGYDILIKGNGEYHYRKLKLTNANLYCVDFVFDESNYDLYSKDVEYIENNFRIN